MPPSLALLARLGAPPDGPAWTALGLSVAILLFGSRLFRKWLALPRAAAIAIAAAAAFALSFGYVVHYLRGAPRIIDATSYWLQARALSEGHFSWPIASPTAEIRGRFLLTSAAPDHGMRIGVIFPPGYPLALAAGFLLHAPMLVGPVIAAAIVWATYELALAVSPEDEAVAKLAALFSVVSAALRYHTADTMSHGLSALLAAVALALASRAARSAARGRARYEAPATARTARVAACGAGLAWGWLFATRPISALALAPALAWASSATRPALIASAMVSSLPPLIFFAIEQHAVTGAWFHSSQTAYYDLADGPPGCFRLAFGNDIGCLHEHGEFVRAHLAGGFGPLAAALTTLRRLRQHVADILNASVLAAWVVIGALSARKRPELRPLAAALSAFPLAYAPFYFDGNYPAGGARFFADLIPIEHVLAAYAIVSASTKFPHAKGGSAVQSIAPGGRRDALLRRVRPLLAPMTLAIALGGFAVHTSFDHVALASREGGRPMFEPSVLAAAGVEHGLVFIDTDHGFDLAYDPDARDPSRSIVVARRQGDDHDAWLWTRLGRPPSFRYVFDVDAPPAVEPWRTPSRRDFTAEPQNQGGSLLASELSPQTRVYRFEAEAEWPPLAQSAGFFEPLYASGTCASGGRVLSVRPVAGRAFTGSIEIPVPAERAGVWRVRPRVTYAGVGPISARLVLSRAGSGPSGLDASKRELAAWTADADASENRWRCADLAPRTVTLDGAAELDVRIEGDGFSIDSIEMEEASSDKSR